MIRYKRLTKVDAADFVNSVDYLSDTAFDDLVMQWEINSVEGFDESYLDLRNNVIAEYKQYKNASDYELDIRIGLCLYEELSLQKNAFTNVLANDDDIWRYLSCKVFPDITHRRYPPTEKNKASGHRLNTKRFYEHTRRIWVKTLWWYIHLSWQGNAQSTYDVLKKFGVDTISQLIERPGKGYRLPLYRALMKEYADLKDTNITSNQFNKIQKMNLVNCRSVEPALSEGGEVGYVKRLLEQSLRKEDGDAD